tara:strand:- start:767 stop:1309 length:543 start_codon:yes stop_codon:yes gene_type:complete
MGNAAAMGYCVVCVNFLVDCNFLEFIFSGNFRESFSSNFLDPASVAFVAFTAGGGEGGGDGDNGGGGDGASIPGGFGGGGGFWVGGGGAITVVVKLVCPERRASGSRYASGLSSSPYMVTVPFVDDASLHTPDKFNASVAHSHTCVAVAAWPSSYTSAGTTTDISSHTGHVSPCPSHAPH